MNANRIATGTVVLALWGAGDASAIAPQTFHFMQIEQVIGGVDGDTSAQAIQLRMRTSFQNFVSASRVRVFDAAGQNPVLIIDMPSDVSNGSTGDRVLITSADFPVATTPSAAPDFTMTNRIPDSYLAAGSMTFESNGGIVYWRLSWGGASYTGPTTGDVTNDSDGEFGPPYPDPLPSTTRQALLFQGSASAGSTSNANDYALTAEAAIFTNNARDSFTVGAEEPTGACCDDASGTCTPDLTQSECETQGGRYGGDGSDCTTIDPPCVPRGACCDETTGTCSDGVAAADCQDAGLRYGGDGSTCDTLDPACTQVPTGACCVELTGTCTDTTTESQCDDLGGRYGGDDTTCASIDPPCEPVIAIGLEQVASGLVSPVTVTSPPDGSGRLFIVDQAGFIRIVDAAGNLLTTPFLDVTDRIVTVDPGFDERGLLGMAFHPDYANNGRFFIRYSAPRTGSEGEPCFDTPRGCHSEVLSEFAVSAGDPNLADPVSETVLFTIDEPEFNHNSGAVMFGPDGLLYFTLGDGGGRDDGLSSDPPLHGPLGNGQNIETALGSLLRIDVDSPPDPGLNYAIPPDNPFAGTTGVDEIFAFGFRNPFTFSFDDGPGGDGALYVADVGQELFEEVNIVTNGGNYGWAVREGFHCFDPDNPTVPPTTCPTTGPILGDPLLDPVMEYLQPIPCSTDADCAPLGVGCGANGLCLNEGGISVIAGHVYRGDQFPALVGKFVFGDFSSNFGTPDGRLYYFDSSGPNAFERRQFFLAPDGAPLGKFLKGFGEDSSAEVYVCTSETLGPTGTTGEVFRITPPLPAAAGVSPRYIAITVPPEPEPFALAVTPACGGPTQYVGQPFGPENIAILVDDRSAAAFLTANEWGGVVHATGVDVVPDTDYNIQIDRGAGGSPLLSAAVPALTAIWGDVAGFADGVYTLPDGQVNVRDVLGILDGFARLPTAPPIYQIDQIGAPSQGPGCLADQEVDVRDVLGSLDGFSGIDFPESTGCPVPCP